MRLLKQNNAGSGTDRNISLVSGWNLIGYNGGVNTSLSNAVFNNGSNSYTWAQALANNKAQAYLAYYDSSSATASQRKYKYLATSDLDMDDTAFRQNKGYAMYANQAGTLTIPEVGGSLSGQTYAYSSLRVRNSSGSEVSIADARTLGWLFTDTGDPYYINYWDSQNRVFRKICEDDLSCNLINIPSWEGIFIWSNKDNVTLIRQN